VTLTRTPRSSRGFTLIELIFAITILASVLTVMYSSFYSLLRTVKALDEKREAQVRASTVLGRIVRELQLAHDDDQSPLLPPRSRIGQPEGKVVFFRGEQGTTPQGKRGDTLTFVARGAAQYLPGRPDTGAVQVSYRVEPDPERPGGAYLVREEVPLITPPEKAYEEALIFPVTKHLVSLEARYYDQDSERWSSQWDESAPNRIPMLIHLTLELASEQGRVERYSTTIAPRSKR
jgi:type II secretion system protein J